MFQKINPTTTKAWAALATHAQQMKEVHMHQLFAEDPDRFKKCSFTFGDLFIDFSKNIISQETMKLLFQLAAECKLSDARKAMFEGDAINETEQRAVLHVALRNFSEKPFYVSGKNVMDNVQRVQQQMNSFCKKVHSGEWLGHTGKK